MASANPFDEAFACFKEPEPRPSPRAEAAQARARQPVATITEAGAYADIPAEDYHGAEICPGPSISASGLKLISSKSPLHFWQQSPLNPARPPQADKKHFAIGRALHDLLLIEGKCPADYHVVPDGFSAKHHIRWAEEMPGYDAAVAAGKTILTASEFATVQAMAESVSRHELAGALLTAGTPEMTLACQDPKTGRWIRARPDVLPTTMEIIPDVKTAANAAPDAYERDATKFGYFQSAAHYLDVLDVLYGYERRRFVLIVIEKEPPFLVTIYHLDDADIHYGRVLNRHALNLFDQCLRTGVWHGYSPPGRPILPLQLAPHARARIDRAIEAGDLSYDL